ncbi:MAG: amidohydrolase family protein [Myxococcota bacterium]
MYDILIRNAIVVDGTGRDRFPGEVAIRDGRIAAVGRPGELAAAEARETIDARGCALTPGWVDIHSHYDGQATWDPILSPSGEHGVTTVVMGNCGVGFAPAAPDRHDWLIQLMEGVEDIPGTALAEGIQWAWESFPEYLDALETHERILDVATQVPHGAVRAYVMGERGARNELATKRDIDAMAAIVREAIEAGALGFSTSRTTGHRARDGEPVPGTFAAEEELFAIGHEMRKLGKGLFEAAAAGAGGEDVPARTKEVEMFVRLSAEIGRPVSFAHLQVDTAPDDYLRILDVAERGRAVGADVTGQVAGRPFGILAGFQVFSPYSMRPAYQALEALPFEEKLARLREPAVRRAILAERPAPSDPIAAQFQNFAKYFEIGNPPNYEPGPELTIAARAAREGRDPDEVMYDAMLADDGRALLLMPLYNYSHGSCDAIYEMLHHPASRLGLSDGGAHCGMICDASIPTFLLTHWVRDRVRGPRVPLEWAVKIQTSETAALYGLLDRGTIEPGKLADLNLIDLDALALERPSVVHDLPAGGRRLLQNARGYVFTMKSGAIVMRDGVPTGARPGKLVRGTRPAPAAA